METKFKHILIGVAISALLILGVAATLPTPVWHGSFIGDISQATNATWAQPSSANLSNAASGSVSGYLTSSDWSVFNGKQAALGFTPLTAVQTTNAATGEASKATNGLGSAAFFASAAFQVALGFTPLTPAASTNAATGAARDATNALGSAAYQTSSTFQTALGFTPLTPSQTTNAATGEALKVTNGLPSSAFGNASGLSTGTVADARLSANVATVSALSAMLKFTNGSGYFSAIGPDTGPLSGVSIYGTNASTANALTSIADFDTNGMSLNYGSFSGSGARLTALPAASLTGSISDARLSANVPLLNAANVFTAPETFSSVKLNAPTNAATVVNLGLDANGNIATNASAIGAGGSQTPITADVNGAQKAITNLSGLTLGGVTAPPAGGIIATGTSYLGPTSITNGGVVLLPGGTNIFAVYNTNGTLVFGVGTNGITYTGGGLTTKAALSTSGSTITGGDIQAATSGDFIWLSASRFHNYADGAVVLKNQGNARVGSLQMGITNSTKVANYTIATMDSGIDFNDNGAVSAHTNTLPASIPGTHVYFTCLTAQTMSVNAASQDTIRYGGTVSAVAGSIFGSAAGNTIHIKCPVTNVWIVDQITGTWTGPQ